jgi:hypothetical protein
LLRSERRIAEGSGRFLKKAAQKFLLIWAGRAETSTAQFKKGFFAPFCSQKIVFPIACPGRSHRPKQAPA